MCRIAGIFTVPVSGVWRVTFSMQSLVNTGEYNNAFLYENNYKRWETEHGTHSASGRVRSTGGREWTLEARAGQFFYLKADSMDGIYLDINFCAEYISKM